MFYDTIKKELISGGIFYKEVEFRDENNETHQGVDTYFLDSCDDETLRALKIARVIESKPIDRNYDIYKEIIKTDRYDEPSNTYYIDYELRDISLDDAKAVKLEELKAIKEEKLLFIPFKNTTFQIDTEAKINISGKVSEIMLANLNNTPLENIAWIDKDNTIITFSKDEFLEFGVNIAKYTESIIFKNDELRNKVKNATSLEELNLIAWESEK